MAKEAQTLPITSADLSSETHEFLPQSTYELIDWLASKYPARSIRKGQSLEDAHREAGARELVDKLIEMRAEELENAQSVDSGAKRSRRGARVPGR